MKYNEISVIDKLFKLQEKLIYSTILAESIGVFRRTILNWRQKPESIAPNYRLDIDVLYCQHFLIPKWDVPKQAFEAVLLPDNLIHNETMFLPFLRRLSFGTIEIETDMLKTDFDKVIDDKKLPKNMDRQASHSGFNAFMTHRLLWQQIVE